MALRTNETVWDLPSTKFTLGLLHLTAPFMTSSAIRPIRTRRSTDCSSVDPWHEPSGINDKRDQVGLDFFYTSGYTRGLPAMVPVSMLYGTPEDSAAQIADLLKRRYPISYVEMGEEQTVSTHFPRITALYTAMGGLRSKKKKKKKKKVGRRFRA